MDGDGGTEGDNGGGVSIGQVACTFGGGPGWKVSDSTLCPGRSTYLNLGRQDEDLMGGDGDV